MTGILIVAGLVIVLAVALGPAHRRRGIGSFNPAGTARDDGLIDADRRRVSSEIDAAAQRSTLRASRLFGIAARGQGAIPLHRRRVSDRPGRIDHAA